MLFFTSSGLGGSAILFHEQTIDVIVISPSYWFKPANGSSRKYNTPGAHKLLS